MPEIDLDDIPASQRELMLSNMAHSPAFALFCARWDEIVRVEVEAKIFDPETSDATTRELKLVRGQLTGARHPRKIVEAMLRAVKTEKTQQ